MFLETLIFRCLVQGTKFTNAGKTISLKASPGETALFFKIDGNDGRKDCLRIKGESCDCLIYFASSAKKILCLAELKGKDTEQAAKQIINTYDQLTQTLVHSKTAVKQHTAQCKSCQTHFSSCAFCRDTNEDFKWKAFIHQRGSSPNMLRKELVADLVNRFGKHGEGYDMSHKEDIGYLLRK